VSLPNSSSLQEDVRYVFSDEDGTLLRSDQTLSSANASAIAEARAAGAEVRAHRLHAGMS